MTDSLDMRQRILKIRQEEGLSMAKVAKRFGVSVVSVMRWFQNIHAIKKRHRSGRINREALKFDVEEYPDAYQFERAERLGVSEFCIWYALKKLNITYKKNSAASKGNPRKTLCFLRRDKES